MERFGFWDYVFLGLLGAALVATSEYASRGDAYSYLQNGTLIESQVGIATAGGTTNLVYTSPTNIQFTGVSNQTAALPSALTIPNGRRFNITNSSTGLITVKDFSGTTLATLPAGSRYAFVLATRLVAAGTWEVETVASLNGLTPKAQTFATGTAGTDFGVSSSGSTHTFNLPNSSSVNTGKLTNTDWSTFNGKMTPNGAITPATKTKITYDARGLVTAGASAATTDLSDVSLASPTVNQVLQWNGAAWTNGNVNTSGTGSGVSFFLDDTAIITGTTNATSVLTLLKAPNTAIAEQEDSIVVTSATSPVLDEFYLYNTALATTTVPGGVWYFNFYTSASTAAGAPQLLVNVYDAIPGAGTVTTTGAGTTRTATVTGGTPFVAGDATGDASAVSMLQTTTGVFPITAFTSTSVVTITVPAGYANQAGVAYSKNLRLFQAASGAITNAGGSGAETFQQFVSAQPAFTVGVNDKLSVAVFGTTTTGPSKTIFFTHNGNTRYSNILTPLQTAHNDLFGIQGGSATERYHLTSAQFTNATQNATSLLTGLLSSTDWSTFNGKQSVFSIGALGAGNANGLDLTANVLTLHPANITQPGAVSTAAQTFAGDKTLANAVAITQTDDATTGTILALGTSGKSSVRLTAGSAVTLSGIANGAAGKIVSVVNATGNPLTVSDEAGGATAANRIRTGTGAALTIGAEGEMLVQYDSTASRWRVTGGAGGGGSPTGTANYAAYFNGGGALSSEQYLAKSRGGTGADNSSVTFANTGTVQGITPAAHGVVVSGSAAVGAVVAPAADTRKVLTSGGTGADPTYKMPMQNFRNFAVNPNCELGNGNYTASAGTFTQETGAANLADPTVGTSCKWVTNTDAATLTNDGYTITSGQGPGLINGAAFCYFKATAATFSLVAMSGGVETGNVQAIASGSNFVPVASNEGFPDSGAITYRVKHSGTNSDTVYFGGCILADAKAVNLSTVSQPTFVGSIKWNATASCIWELAATSFTEFSGVSACGGATITYSGLAIPDASTPGQKPQIRFAGLSSGRYYAVATGVLASDSIGTATDSGETHFEMYDGATSWDSDNGIRGLGASSRISVRVPNATFEKTYTSGLGDTTLRIRTKNLGGGSTEGVIDARTGSFMISVYKYPTSNQLSVTPDMTRAYAGVVVAAGTGQQVTVTNGSYTKATDVDVTSGDKTHFGVATLTATNGDYGFSVPSLPAGDYVLFSTGGFQVEYASSGTTCYFGISDDGGTTVKTEAIQLAQTSGTISTAPSLLGLVSYSQPTGAKDFTIYIKRSSGGGNCYLENTGPKFTLGLFPLSQLFTAPVLLPSGVFGGAQWDGGSGKSVTVSSGTPTIFSTANYATRTNLGSAANPSNTSNMEFTMPSLPAGVYEVTAHGPAIAYSAGAQGASCIFQLTDGTNVSGNTPAEARSVAGLSNFSAQSHIAGIFDYSSGPVTNKTFSVQGYLVSGAGSCIMDLAGSAANWGNNTKMLMTIKKLN